MVVLYLSTIPNYQCIPDKIKRNGCEERERENGPKDFFFFFWVQLDDLTY